ncbi:MAG: hypothetical protein HDT20_03810 [Oscillibacter sp.]|nr:hypothetical protein [Oscillibacter sp.]
MADKPISGLRRALDIYDDSLLVVEQQGEAVTILAILLKKYARQGVADYVETAQKAAETATNAVAGIDASVKAAQDAQGAAETAQEGAETAQKAIEDMEVDSTTLPAGSPASVEKTAAEGHVKLVFGLPTGKTGARGPAGSSIEKIERTAGTGAAGTVDTYTITLTDGSTHDFKVYNGADGKGAGDMLASLYDPQGKKQDVFAYADGLLPVIHDLTLPPEGWEGEEAPYTLTVTVPGVLADEAAQIIHIQPSDRAGWAASGLECTGQGENTLTFKARDRPAEAVHLLAAVQAAKGGTSM